MEYFTNPYNLEENPKPATFFTPVKLNPAEFQPVDFSALEKKANELSGAPNIKNMGGSVSETVKNIGGKVANNLGDILGFGANQVANFSNTARNSKEGTAQTIKSGIEGAALGFKIGGPIGAGAGAIVGTGLSLIDNKRDKDRRIEEADREHREMLKDRKQQRKKAFNLLQGKQTSTAGKSVTEKQYEFINQYL